MPHIILNPGGNQDFGLIVIVEATTGVTYQEQCGGVTTDQRTMEGFLIPVGDAAAAQKIYDWFWDTFEGQCQSINA